jgi:uncharacterized iron-regulated membrane protein
MPLKIIWALLDIATIVVLASGLYLWFARRRTGAQAALGWEKWRKAGRARAAGRNRLMTSRLGCIRPRPPTRQ